MEIDFLQGDAEALPFADGEFDRVISVFGAMFAPRHTPTANELLRVIRPGGTLVLATWAPDGVMSRMIASQALFIPPPEGAEPPPLWGEESHVRELLAGAAELAVEPDTLTLRDESVDHYLATLQASLGPLVAVKAASEAAGRWPEAQAMLHGLWDAANTATDGSMAVDAGYLVIVARA